MPPVGQRAAKAGSDRSSKSLVANSIAMIGTREWSLRLIRPTIIALRFALTASLALSIPFALFSQVTSADLTRRILKFDFSSAVAAPGFVHVAPTTIYSPDRGYGFRQPIEVLHQSGLGSLCSEKSFRFSASVPEGNYNVAISFGDQSTPSVTTVKGEARRLMLEKVSTSSGQIVTRNFTINVRAPLLKSGGEVKLKADEQGHFDWDNVLTLEFGDAHPCVRSLEITPVDGAVTVYIAGDSTVTDQAKE